MKNETLNTCKKAMILLQSAIELLEKVQGENEDIDSVCDNLGFAFADLEFEINK